MRAHSIKRRILSLFCLVLWAGGSASVQAQNPGEVRIGHNRAWGNPALLIGITQGHFEKAGVKVVERSFNNPADIVQAIATGDLDAGVSPSGVLFTAIQRGVKISAVALAQGSHNPPVSYVVRTDSGIDKVGDLRGKTLGIAGFGGTGDLYLRYWITKAGINPKSDVKITFVPFHLTLPAIVNKQIDIGLIDSVLAVKAQRQHPGQTKVLFDYVDVTKDAIGNANTNALLLVFGGAFVERDRQTAVRFLEGYLRAIQSIHADPKKALSDWASASKEDAIRALTAPVTLPRDGKVYLDAFKFEADLALKFGYLKQPIDVRTAVDNSLIEEAAARLK